MSVKDLQANLAKRGLYSGAADGLLGPLSYQGLAEYATDGKAPPGTGEALSRWLPFAGIKSRDHIIQFIANCAHESNFQPKSENLNYTAKRLTQVWPSRFPTLAAAAAYASNPEKLANKVYSGRMGNTMPGDGWKFRGRAAPQLTGREAYRKVGQLVNMPFEDDPELVNTVNGGIAAAAGFWIWKGLGKLTGTKPIRYAWNGGYNGLDDVQLKVAKQQAIWPA